MDVCGVRLRRERIQEARLPQARPAEGGAPCGQGRAGSEGFFFFLFVFVVFRAAADVSSPLQSAAAGPMAAAEPMEADPVE